MNFKKAAGWITLVAGWMVLSIVCNPPLITRDWFIALAAVVLFSVSGSLMTASAINKWPWDIE